uniref:Uncharacterized protein n=1 Tax=Rhizophora mucronata TaxID=61149 RepID=A0A2P2J4W8_RHIMU
MFVCSISLCICA